MYPIHKSHEPSIENLIPVACYSFNGSVYITSSKYTPYMICTPTPLTYNRVRTGL